MACNGITDYLHRHGSVFLENEYKARVFPASLWNQIMPRGVFPQGKGLTISQVIYERTAPTTSDTLWSDMTIEDGQEGGACRGPTTNVPIGSTSVSAGLKLLMLQGPDFCAEDLRFSFNIPLQLSQHLGSMGNYVARAWEDRNRNEYFRAVKYKVSVVVAGLIEINSLTATTYSTTVADAIMTLGILDHYRNVLMLEGYTPMLMDNGFPVVTAIASLQTQGAIVRGNATLQQTLRDAYSGAGERALLLRSLGASFTIQGILIMADTFNRKFSFSAGVYTSIPAFTMSAATKGLKADMNATYRTATLEETFLFDPTVMTQLVPEPISSQGSGFDFNPVNYTGDWALLNILDRQCNPRGQNIYPHGILAAASLYGSQERGAAFVHKSCPTPLGLTVTCPT